MTNTWMPFLVVGLTALSVSAIAAEHPELKAFPPAKEGMERFVIVLPHKDRGEEDAFRVEIIVGKEMLTDGVNVVRLANTIESRPLPGWAYTYYEATGWEGLMVRGCSLRGESTSLSPGRAPVPPSPGHPTRAPAGRGT